MIRDGFLQQNATSEIDASCPLAKQHGMLSLVLGEMAQTILVSQKILPHLLQRRGFTFQYPSLQSALADMLAS